MKRIIPIIALLLALIMVLTGCDGNSTVETGANATATSVETPTPTPTPNEVAAETEAETEAQTEAEAPAERVVLMSVGGVPVYQDDVEYYSSLTYMYYMYGYMDYYFGYLDSLQYLIYNDVAASLLTEGKVEALLGENYETLYENYGAEFDSYVDQQAQSYMAEEGYAGTYEDAYAQALTYYEEGGYTRETYIQRMLAYEAYEVYRDGIEIEITDEEIQAYYDELAEANRAEYEGNLSLYEYYVLRLGEESFYTPEGYRGILHILVGADEELLSAYSNADDEESKQAAAEAVIASIQDTLDEIYAKFEAGTPFVDLIAEYNIDPGMTDEYNLANGYQVHKDGGVFMSEFTQGSFSEEMQAPGDISKPIVTSYGVHILYYLKDIPAGIAEMDEATAAYIAEDLRYEKLYNYIIEQLKQYEVIYYPAYEEVIGKPNFLDD